LVFFTEYPTIDLAKQIANQLIFVKENSLPPLETGEYYWHQLENMDVYEINAKKVIGRVEYLFNNIASDIMVVVDKDNSKKRNLIPFRTQDIILDIDLEKKIIKIDWDCL
jgi:16S rRNA processing protein RimM